VAYLWDHWNALAQHSVEQFPPAKTQSVLF
jgi:hypothetical protein